MKKQYTNGVATLAFSVLSPDDEGHSLAAAHIGRSALSSLAAVWESPNREAEFQERFIGAGLEDTHLEQARSELDPFGDHPRDRRADFALPLDNDESETIRVDFPMDDGELRALRTCAMFADMMGVSIERPVPHYEFSPDNDDDPYPEFKGVAFRVNGTNHVQVVSETADRDEVEYVSRVFSMNELDARMASQAEPDYQTGPGGAATP